MAYFNKLVRDRIPEIMDKAGEKAVFKEMNDAEYRRCLEEKLDEEVAEFHESNQLDELADILEVVYALSEAYGQPVDELMAAYRKKHEERGGFSKKILLTGKE